jgi:hypothetical protein
VAISIVEKQEFRELIGYLNGKIPMPSRKGLINECLNYFNESKQEIKSKLITIDSICLGADLWSKKGLSESYLGISAYFYDKNIESKTILTLGLKQFPHPHNAERIKAVIESILTDYEIPLAKVFRFISDNGSNMVKTFKLEWKEVDESEEFNLIEEDNDLESDLEDIDEDFDEEEFETEEVELNSKLSEIKIVRMGCFIHILQCVIKTCDKKSKFKEVIKSATNLINKFRRSGKMAEILKSEAGSVLPTITPTRWNSLYLQMNGLIEKKSEIIKICTNEKIDCLRIKEWDSLQEYVQLLKPFNDITNEMSKDFDTTIPKVYSSIRFLKHHLHSFIEKGSDSAKHCAKLLTEDIDKRFDHFFNVENEKFSDGIYIASTFMDPRFARILDEKQRNCAITFIKQYFQQYINNTEANPESDNNNEIQESSDISEFEAFMATDLSRTGSQTIYNMDLDKQLIQWGHIMSKSKVNMKTDALNFWKEDISVQNLLDLKNIALNILCTPSSTATVERIFSAAGNACIGRRNRLSNSRLEMIVFFKNNAKFLNTLNLFK